MNIKIKSSNLLLASASVLLLASCTKKFDQLNTNPYQPTEDMLEWDNFRVGSFFPQMQLNVVPVDVNTYQLDQNLIGDVYAGYMGAIGQWESNRNSTTYAFVPHWVNSPFNTAFTKVMPAWLDVKKRSEGKNPEAFALAEILKVSGMHRTTDIYGPIPYSKFGSGALTTEYDSQEAVYRKFITELDEAIDVLTSFVQANPGKKPLGAYDLIYGGDFAKWVVYANSLKLRLAMRMVYADANAAKLAAEEAVNHPLGVMKANTDNALLKSVGSYIIRNPIKTIWDEYVDVRMGANMESFLKGYNDPRLAARFEMATIPNVTADYYGVRNGITISSKSTYSPFSIPKIDNSTPIEWMTAAEIYFLRAEGALRGWNMQGTPQELYEAGIRHSFEHSGVSGADAYINNSVSVPAPYANPVVSGQNVPAGSDLLSTITIQWNDADSFERKLERILTQKWIAIYPNGQEAWSEFRRTKYPKVFPVVVNNSGGVVNTTTQVRRLPFPQSEYNTNPQGVSGAVNLLGGADNGGTKLWWDKKP